MIRNWLERLIGRRAGRLPPLQTCSIEGCNGYVLARGWCSEHYQRWKRNGDPEGQPAHRKESYTAAEDRMLLSLPINPATGYVLRGHLQAAADHLGRSVGGVGHRRSYILAKRRRRQA